ncbi:MAG: hypothetical protein K2X01_00210 [Cyanobacteria bacterium]|nr:hypothetical protein [Cyanobacteriota bacterium]
MPPQTLFLVITISALDLLVILGLLYTSQALDMPLNDPEKSWPLLLGSLVILSSSSLAMGWLIWQSRKNR